MQKTSQERSASESTNQDSKSATTLADNREQTSSQQALKNLAANSPRTLQQKALASQFTQSPRITSQQKQQDTFKQNQPPLQRKANNTGLPDNLKTGIESLSGISMDSVKVHYNSAKPAQMNAHAYAQGTDIHVAAGQEKHLPHEAWHVVQQAQGRVKPTTQMKNAVPINDDAGLEREADVMGEKANNLNLSNPVQQLAQLTFNYQAPIQGFFQVDTNRISENMNIVWEGQKDVYATANKFTESNQTLDAKNGKYLLHRGAAKNYGGNTTFYHVEPRLNPRTTTVKEQDLQPTMGDSDEMLHLKHQGYMQELRWVEEDLEEFKNEFATELTRDPNWRKPLNRKGVIGMKLNAWCHAEPFRHDLLFTELAQATLKYEDHNSLETMTADIAKVQIKFHAFVERENNYPRAISLPNDCAQCVSELVGGQAARERGNENPDIGGNYHEGLRSPNRNQIGWNFHWAGVIMKDGGDNISLESAAGMSITNNDRQTWWFGMYGTQKPEQTFKYQIKEFHYKRNIQLLLQQLPDGIENYRFNQDFGLILDIQQMRNALKELNGGE